MLELLLGVGDVGGNREFIEPLFQPESFIVAVETERPPLADVRHSARAAFLRGKRCHRALLLEPLPHRPQSGVRRHFGGSPVAFVIAALIHCISGECWYSFQVPVISSLAFNASRARNSASSRSGAEAMSLWSSAVTVMGA